MSERKSLGERFNEFQPSKTLWFWSCAGCVVATVVVGFTVGGWVTGGTAREMAQESATEARAQVVASVCVERFMAADNVSTRLAELKEASSWDRDNLIEEGGWLQLPGIEEAAYGAADMCAEQLATMEAPTGTDSAPVQSASETAG